MKCPQCGTENPDDAMFCGKCGRNIGEAKAQPQQLVINEQTQKFVRCTDNRMVAGVCSGIAKYTNLDLNLVRALTVISFLFTGSATFWAYIIMWIIIPEEPCGQIQ